MVFISLGTINKKISFAIIAGIYELFANIFLYERAKVVYHPFITGINAGLGLSLCFFPFLYLKLRERKKRGLTSSVIISQINNAYNHNIGVNKNRKKKFLYILAIISLDFSQKFLSFFFQSMFLENLWVFDITFLLLFSNLILKNKFYSHHFLSLIMMSIIAIILNVINYHKKDVDFWEVADTLLIDIIFCLENVLCKYVMEIKFSSPYEICFFIGLFELIIFSILLIIFTNVPVSTIDKITHINENYIDNFYIYLDEINLLEVLIFILLMLLRCCFILFGFITADYFTPAHIILISMIGEFSFIFVENYDWKLYLKIVFFVFLVFFLLVFIEIIELNIFGLQKNTKKNISKRSESERSKYDYNLSDIDSSNNNNSRNESSDENSRISLISQNGGEYYL